MISNKLFDMHMRPIEEGVEGLLSIIRSGISSHVALWPCTSADTCHDT